MSQKTFFTTSVTAIMLSMAIIASFFVGALADRLFVIKPLDYLAARQQNPELGMQEMALGGTNPTNIADLSEEASKSVITVAVKQKVPVYAEDDLFGIPGIFNFRVPKRAPSSYEETQQDIGSGFVVDPSGLIITNKHVVSGLDDEYVVIGADNSEYPVEKIYRDPTHDIAILKISASLPAIELGDSDALRVGEEVIAIGTALGEFRHTVTTGVISGLGRGITAGGGWGQSAEVLENVIQTDAAINPGNSGGPLLNQNGQVIGVNVAVSQSGQNIGFALPINTIKQSLTDFKDTGSFERAYLGVRYQMVSEEAALLNAVKQGAYVLEVVKDSPAEKAGLQKGDIITQIDAEPLNDTQDLAKVLSRKKAGQTVPITAYRNSEKKELALTATLQVQE